MRTLTLLTFAALTFAALTFAAAPRAEACAMRTYDHAQIQQALADVDAAAVKPIADRTGGADPAALTSGMQGVDVKPDAVKPDAVKPAGTRSATPAVPTSAAPSMIAEVPAS